MGQKYAAYDSTGAITAFYDSIDSPVPNGLSSVIEITDEEWQSCIGTSGYTVSNSALVVPAVLTAAQTLALAQVEQCRAIDAAYTVAVQQPVSYKTAGAVTQSFQADTNSQMTLMQAAQGYAVAGSVPSGFYWVASDNTKVLFTMADLQGLYQAMLSQMWGAFQKKQSLKSLINLAQSISSVQAIVWE